MTEQLRNVLIFAHECAPHNRPESTVGAQRPAQFAKYLPEFGWRAVVLCCDYDRRGTAGESDLPAIAEETRRALCDAGPRASVIIPIPSLHSDGLLDRWWRATLSANGNAKKIARKSLTAAKFFTGDYSQNWQPAAHASVCAITEEINIDACIGEHSPDAGLFLARWFSRKFGAPWVADFRDPILQPLGPTVRKLYKPIARRLLRTASGVINVNPFLSEIDNEIFDIPSWSIPNGFDPEEFSGDIGLRRTDRFTIVYNGNIISQQRMEVFIEGLSLLRAQDEESFKDVRFVYRGLAHKRISQMVREVGVSDAADIKDRIEREAVLDLIKRAELLLLLSIAEPEKQDFYFSKGLYPAKVFEYFGARRPIISVPGDGGLLDELIERTATGITLRSPREVADYLSQAIQEWKSGRSILYNPEDEEVRRYTRRSLSGQLAEVLNSISKGAQQPISTQKLAAAGRER
jgi:glycosyltransferase involved in cell wall biosynthesis